MKSFAKTIILALLLAVIPSRIWAQIRDYENGFLFNVFEIENVEERVQLASALATSDIWICNPTDHPGELFIRPNNQHADIPIYAEFDYLRTTLREEYEEASLLPKEEFREIFNSWAHNISNEYYNFLISDHLDRANHCMDAEPFCTSDVYNFPALNSGYSWSGPNYGCLGTSPTNKHSFWYYMRIGVAGNITILIEASFDVDFALWGPFSNQTDPCPTQTGEEGLLSADCSDCPNNTTNANFYPSGNLHDCSFDARHYEYAHVVNGQVGQYYILLITNYSGSDGYITFQKYDGDGETDCGIMPGFASNDGPYCEDETIQLHINEQPNATYLWTGPDGWTSTEPHPTRENCTLAMAGVYTIITTVGAQTTPATTEVYVYQQPTPSFTATTVCQGEATEFTGLASGANVANYDWDFGDGDSGSGQNVDHTYSEAGTYQVTLTVTAEDGTCPGEITQTVTVNVQPVADAGPDQSLPYPGLTAQLSGTGGGSGFNYHWEPANMVVNSNSQNTETVTLFDTQRYVLTVTNPQGGCISYDTVFVYIGTSPLNVDAIASPNTLCEGESTQLQVMADGGSGNFSYSWTPTTGLSATNISNPVATPTQTITYTCTVTDNITTDSRQKTVTVTVNHHHVDGSIVIDESHPDYRCDSIPFDWFGNTLYFKENGTYSFPNEAYPDGQTTHGCDTAMVVTVTNMKYSPEPSKMVCTTENAVVFGAPDSDADTVAVVTNTEFFSFQYDFMVEETGHDECIWNTCKWEISNPSWAIGDTITERQSNGFYYSKCTVYVAEHNDDYVILTATMSNGCNSKQSKFYLKSSFLGVGENNSAAAKVSIVPNPNNGQMRINFEDMEGLTSVKVFDMTGNQIDAFETNVSTSLYSYDYTMKQYAEGIYLFAFTNNGRIFTKKVVIIQ